MTFRRERSRRCGRALMVLCLAALLQAACTDRGPSREATLEALESLPQPPLEQLDPAVVEQYHQLFAGVRNALAGDASAAEAQGAATSGADEPAPGGQTPDERVTNEPVNDEHGPATAISEALGTLGMWHQTYQFMQAAEHCFERALDWRDDPRWSYYLALLHATRPGESTAAHTRFEHVLQHHPDHLPTLIRLGDLMLAEGAPARATTYFDRAQVVATSTNERARASLGLGRAALLAGQVEEAVVRLTQAHEEAPRSGAVRYTLAQARRLRGDDLPPEDEVPADLALAVPSIADPWFEAMGALRAGRQRHLRDGKRALNAGRAAVAVASFRTLVEAEDQAPSPAARREARYLLAQALLMSGQPAMARTHYERVLAEAPRHTGSLVGLASILAPAGDLVAAEAALRLAREGAPHHPSVLLNLAQLLRLQERFEDALDPIAHLSAQRPTLAVAGFWHAATLSVLGRFDEARTRLEATLASPEASRERLLERLLLARLLAASPAAILRDGRRAVDLAQSVFRRRATVDAAETLAMALAEVDNFEAARALQDHIVTTLIKRFGSEHPATARARDRQRFFRERRNRYVPWEADELPVALPVSAPSRSVNSSKPTAVSMASSTAR